MKYISMILISVISAFISVVVASILLPAVVTDLEALLSTLTITSVSNLIGWLGEIFIMISLVITIIVLSQRYNILVSIRALLISFISSVLIVSLASFIIIASIKPELFDGIGIGLKLLNFFRYPSILSILFESPQTVWIGTTFIQVLLCNIKFYQLSDIE